jgi:hypothetical protein
LARSRRNAGCVTAHVFDLGVIAMDLWVWLPALFGLGVVSMGLCLLFAAGCARI